MPAGAHHGTIWGDLVASALVVLLGLYLFASLVGILVAGVLIAGGATTCVVSIISKFVSLSAP